MEQNKLIVITSVLYNEVCYIEEWINFHLKHGFDLVYLYIRYKENEDNNIFKAILDKYEKYENVKLFHHKWRKWGHIKDFLKNNVEYENDWISFLDIDEFLYSPIEDKSIKDIIYEYEQKQIYAVKINWNCFGSNGLIEKPKQVVGSYGKPANKYCGLNLGIKSLIKFNSIELNKQISSPHWLHLKNDYNYYTSSGILCSLHNKKNYNIIKTNLSKFLTHMQNKYVQVSKIELHYTYPEENPLLLIDHYITRSKNDYLIKTENNPNCNGRYNNEWFDLVNTYINNNK